MRELFHRKRSKRYDIVLKELKNSFLQYGGWNLLFEMNQQQKSKISLKDKRVIKKFNQLSSSLNTPNKKNKLRHSHFLRLLRSLLSHFESAKKKNELEGKLYLFLLELCFTKFCRMHFFDYGHKLINEMMSHRDQGLTENFLIESNHIHHLSPKVFLERDLRKFNETVCKVVFDPHKYNHPFLLYKLSLYQEGNLKIIKMIRMGSPTSERVLKRPQVIEEFKGYLAKLSLTGKNHLYINKQKTWDIEGRRSDALIDLEKNVENFYLICLPSDGSFYYQDEEYKDCLRASEFKQDFFDLLTGKKKRGYYHLPKAFLKDESFLKSLQGILDDVHISLYNGAQILTQKERRYFIEHVYTQLIILCIRQFPVDSMNITCKDGIDRAGCEQFKLLYYFQLYLGLEKDTDSIYERQFLVHFPPYLAKSRPMVKERREFLFEFYNHLKDVHSDTLRLKYQNDPFLHSKPHFVKRANTTL